KKAGSMFECRSPFSEDKTASFKVSPAKNNWVCYSSDKKGDGIKFVMLRDNCTFIEAVEKIAGICGIVLEQEQISEQQQLKINQRTKQLDVLEAVSKEYQKQFRLLPADHWAKVMIANRQFNQQSMLEFEIGYAPGTFRHVTSGLTEKGLYETGKSTGLISAKDGKSYDFFNDRLMFPIHNVKGDVVAFGGRAQ